MLFYNMEVKKYKPEFVLDYLYKNRKKYNKYFQNKMKDIDKYRIFSSKSNDKYKIFSNDSNDSNDKYGKYNIFYSDLTKEHKNYITSQDLIISFNAWDVTNKKKIVYDKLYSRNHKNGWIISGEIYAFDAYITCVTFIKAFHKSYGIIYGNFSEEIIVVSNNPDKALFHFLDNNMPLVWNGWDI